MADKSILELDVIAAENENKVQNRDIKYTIKLMSFSTPKESDDHDGADISDNVESADGKKSSSESDDDLAQYQTGKKMTSMLREVSHLRSHTIITISEGTRVKGG